MSTRSAAKKPKDEPPPEEEQGESAEVTAGDYNDNDNNEATATAVAVSPPFNSSKKAAAVTYSRYKTCNLSQEDKKLRRKLIREIANKKTKLERSEEGIPWGWAKELLSEDPDGLYQKFGITRYDIYNEERRRKKLRERGLPVDTGEDDDEGNKKRKSRKKTANDDNDDEPAKTKRKRKRLPSSSSDKNATDETEAENSDGSDDDNDDSDSGEAAQPTSPPPKKKKRRHKLPRRRGKLKPVAYQEAYKRFDQANADRDAYLQSIEKKRKKVKELQQELDKAQQELQNSQNRLKEYDATVLQPAKDNLMECELSMDVPWTRKYHQLLAYKEKNNGNLKNLPSRCPEDKELDSLCVWVNAQRSRRRRVVQGISKIHRPHQVELLDRIGFEWNLKDKWQDHFDELMKFKQHHGHCMVPQKYVDQKLANWVVFQRQEMTQLKRDGSCKNLNPERIARLDQVGFVWSVFDLKWNKIYDKLKDFHSQHGHCRVPKHHDVELSNWIRSQREQYIWYQDEEQRKKNRKCKLLPEKIAKLEAIGFEWNEETAMLEDIMNLGEEEEHHAHDEQHHVEQEHPQGAVATMGNATATANTHPNAVATTANIGGIPFMGHPLHQQAAAGRNNNTAAAAAAMLPFRSV